MSCCGVCGGQKPEEINEQDKNKEPSQTMELSQTTESPQTVEKQEQEKK